MPGMQAQLSDHSLHVGAPVRHPAVSRVICAVLCGVLALAGMVNLAVLAGLGPEVLSVFDRALARSTALAIIPLGFLWFLDRRERESPWLFAAAFLWGGCIATGLAVPINTAFIHFADVWVREHPQIKDVLGPDAPLLLAAPISAPIVEEISKALGVWLIFVLLKAEFDNMRDGIVYGALVGLGFNWFEAALYVAQGYAEFGTPPYGAQLGARYALFGLGGHALFTGLFGAFLGLARQTRRRWLRYLSPLIGLSLAIAAHMLNNALPLFLTLAGAAQGEPPPGHEAPPEVSFLQAFWGGTLLHLTVHLPFLLIMAVALWRSGVWERTVIREELADELGPNGAVTAREYKDIVADRILHTRRIQEMRPYASAALVNAQNELAFRKRRLKDLGLDPELDPSVAAWRRQIARLRAVPFSS
jgi:RsiW-degrading membrane proteinase PrsW (M82 family)